MMIGKKYSICILSALLTLLVVISGCEKAEGDVTHVPVVSMELYGEKDVIVNYGSQYIDEGVLVTVDGTDVSEKVQIASNLDIDTIGEYTIEYTYEDKFLTRNIQVTDTQPPKIVLQGNTTAYIAVGQEYIDAGYIAEDNYDGDISDSVILFGEVDCETEGEYTLEYKVNDSNGNETSTVREVVVRTSPLTQSLEEFTLDGLFEGTILPEHEPDYEEFAATTVMIGDSRNQSFAYYKLFDGDKVWGKEGLTPFKMYTKKVLNHGTFEKEFVDDMVAKYPPQIVIFSMGAECIGSSAPEDIAKAYREYLTAFRVKFPDIEIVIHSIMPVHETYDLHRMSMWDYSTQKANNANYYIAQMCSEIGVYFIDSSSVLKNEKGLGDPQYYIEDKVHLNEKGQAKVFDYILAHSLILDNE